MKQDSKLKFLAMYNEILFIYFTLKTNHNYLCKSIRTVININNESLPNIYVPR